MKNIDEIFNHIKELKKQQRPIMETYREMLEDSDEYQEITEKLKTFKIKKAQIEENVKGKLRTEFDKLDGIKRDIETHNILLSDAALTKLMKGEKVEIIDEYQNKYEPEFNVKFKKA